MTTTSRCPAFVPNAPAPAGGRLVYAWAHGTVGLVDHLASSPAKATVLMVAIGLRAAYPDLDLATVFTPTTISDIPRIETECVDTTMGRYESTPTGEVITRDPSTVTEVRRILEANTTGPRTIADRR